MSSMTDIEYVFFLITGTSNGSIDSSLEYHFEASYFTLNLSRGFVNESFVFQTSSLERNVCVHAPNVSCLNSTELSAYKYMDTVPYYNIYNTTVGEEGNRVPLFLLQDRETYDGHRLQFFYFFPASRIFIGVGKYFDLRIPNTVPVTGWRMVSPPAQMKWNPHSRRFVLSAFGHLNKSFSFSGWQVFISSLDPLFEPEPTPLFLNLSYIGVTGFNFGPAAPVIEKRGSGRILQSLRFDSRGSIDMFSQTLGVHLNLPSWVTWENNEYATFSALAVFSSSLELIGVYFWKDWTSFSSCGFVGPTSSFILCAGSVVHRESRYWDEAQVVLIDTETNTVLSKPFSVPGDISSPSFDTSFMKAFEMNPCHLRDDVEEVRESRGSKVNSGLFVMVAGEQGMVQARTGSVVQGSQAVVSLVDVSSLFSHLPPSSSSLSSVSQIDSISTMAVKPVLNFTVPETTYVAPVSDEEILSFTVVSSVDWKRYRNLFSSESSLEGTKNMYLFNTLIRFPLTHTKPADMAFWVDLVVSDMCPNGEHKPVEKPTDPNSGVSNTTIGLISAGGFLFVFTVTFLLYRRQIRRPDDEKRLLS